MISCGKRLLIPVDPSKPPYEVAAPGWPEQYYPHPDLSEEDRADAQRGVADFRRCLGPADPKTIALRIAGLLAHWYVPEVAPELRAVVIGDWAAVLREFPDWAVKEACIGWLSRETAAPKPVHIAVRCREATAEANLTLHNLQRLLAWRTGGVVSLDEERQRRDGGGS